MVRDSRCPFGLAMIFSQVDKEQLCSNASIFRGWLRKAPPYVSIMNVVVPYSLHYVALPLLFSPLSVFCRRSVVEFHKQSAKRQHIEDKFLVLSAGSPSYVVAVLCSGRCQVLWPRTLTWLKNSVLCLFLALLVLCLMHVPLLRLLIL